MKSALNNQDWDLEWINHKLLGLKTIFHYDFLEDIELYTWENEDKKMQINDNKDLSKFIFL